MGSDPRSVLRLCTPEDRAPPASHPKPDPPEPPARPEWLDEVGRAAWDELAPKLAETRVLTETDRNALGRYCAFYAQWRRAEEFIAKHGCVYPVLDSDGSLKIMRKHPQVEIAFEAARQMARLESEFGLTPSSRARVPAEPPPAVGPAAFLRGGA